MRDGPFDESHRPAYTKQLVSATCLYILQSVGRHALQYSACSMRGGSNRADARDMCAQLLALSYMDDLMATGYVVRRRSDLPEISGRREQGAFGGSPRKNEAGFGDLSCSKQHA
jgi:hypothetical protein